MHAAYDDVIDLDAVDVDNARDNFARVRSFVRLANVVDEAFFADDKRVAVKVVAKETRKEVAHRVGRRVDFGRVRHRVLVEVQNYLQSLREFRVRVTILVCQQHKRRLSLTQANEKLTSAVNRHASAMENAIHVAHERWIRPSVT